MASIGPVGPRCQGLCRKVASLRSGGKGLGRRLLKRRGAIMIKPLQPPLRAKENRQTALPAMEMHPYPRLRRYFPLRGKWWRQPPIGVHFHERSEVLRFSILRSRIIKLHRPKGDTTTLGPKGRRPLSEANTTRRRQAATTLGAKPRQPSPMNPFPPVSLCLTASPTGTSSHIFLFQLVPTRSSLFHRNRFSPM